MIIYFSATGNCKFAAEEIAKHLSDKAISITTLLNNITLKNGEPLGIITPTYFWGLPAFVEKFFENVTITGAENSYIFYIATYGTTCGQTDYFLNQLLKKHSLTLSASFGIKTVDNWTVEFDVTNTPQINQILAEEKAQLEAIIPQILSKQKVFIQKDKKSVFMCKCARSFYNRARKTKHLSASNNCIGCGLCAKNCPENAIQMSGGKPIWIKDKCTMCFGCLHSCPACAISYDNKTQKNGQYHHP